MPDWTDDELTAWLDELLPADRMADLESDLRSSDSLRNRLAGLAAQRDGSAHSVGDIWRRQRLSCPSRGELGSFVLGTLEQGLTEYINFHIRTIGCRYCAANLNDLEHSAAATDEIGTRRRRFFQSSAGVLRGDS